MSLNRVFVNTHPNTEGTDTDYEMVNDLDKTTQDVPAPLETSLLHCDYGEVESDS